MSNNTSWQSNNGSTPIVKKRFFFQFAVDISIEGDHAFAKICFNENICKIPFGKNISKIRFDEDLSQFGFEKNYLSPPMFFSSLPFWNLEQFMIPGKKSSILTPIVVEKLKLLIPEFLSSFNHQQKEEKINVALFFNVRCYDDEFFLAVFASLNIQNQNSLGSNNSSHNKLGPFIEFHYEIYPKNDLLILHNEQQNLLKINSQLDESSGNPVFEKFQQHKMGDYETAVPLHKGLNTLAENILYTVFNDLDLFVPGSFIENQLFFPNFEDDENHQNEIQTNLLGFVIQSDKSEL